MPLLSEISSKSSEDFDFVYATLLLGNHKK